MGGIAMKVENFDFTGHKGTELPGYIWLPDGEVKAVLQLPRHDGAYGKI